MHNPEGEINTCDPLELAEAIKELKVKGIVILGTYDEAHIRLYKEAAMRAGINVLLLRVVDKRWPKEYLEMSIKAVENAWAANMAQEREVNLPLTRRELIAGSVKVAEEKIDKPIYISDLCGNLFKACTVCKDSCPYDAIEIDKNSGIGINYEKCTACGLCVGSCPTSAIEFPSISQTSIYAISEVEGDKVVSCYKDSSASFKLPCLAMLSSEDIILLRKKGKLTLKCSGCELQGNLKGLSETAMRINESVGGIELDFPDNKIKANDLKQVKVEGKFQKRSDAKREIAMYNIALKPVLLYDVYVERETCTMCENCAKWCPSSALKIENLNGKRALTFEPEICIGCNVCVNVCPENCSAVKTIKVSKEIKNFEKKVLDEDYMVKCRVCGAPVGSRKSLNHVKAVMKGRGMQVDDEWLELCQKHRSEYSFKKMIGMNEQFKPKGAKKVG